MYISCTSFSLSHYVVILAYCKYFINSAFTIETTQNAATPLTAVSKH